MKKRFKSYDIVVLGLLVCLISIPSIITPVQAQHIDVFKLGPGGSEDLTAKRQHSKTIETEPVKVEDIYYYEVPVEKGKIDKGEIIRTDIDLIEFEDKDQKAAYQWHQVDVLDEVDVVQKHVRTAGKLKCMRARSGVIYWALDGVKYVAWETWGSWLCTK
ncbi:MAG: hypothetical protein ACUZ77_01595 [Candidatus Brocadiales bacterium]